VREEKVLSGPGIAPAPVVTATCELSATEAQGPPCVAPASGNLLPPTQTPEKVPAAAVPAMRALEARFAPPRPRALLARPPRNAYGRWGHTFAALDLGTNNCRLLVARPHQTSFRVLDAYSRTVRLGEGVSTTGLLGDGAMSRTIDALRICAGKIERRGVTRIRAVATEACRTAMNGRDFITAARNETGLEFEIISTREEARLAVESCANLLDHDCENVLVFDIGGGSTELVWLDLTRPRRVGAPLPIRAWTSLPLGVVTLTERFGAHGGSPSDVYRAMVDETVRAISGFAAPEEMRRILSAGRAHMVGNSGTVTTIAGILLGLQRYDRTRVDGAWVSLSRAAEIARDIALKPLEERVAHPCIGVDRADLLLPGAAILEAIHTLWPCERLRVADRGLREGVLLSMMSRADREARKRCPGRGEAATAPPAP
jgi:exopolyphosphatase/guanosine-5'-triphosphate,3'-diphosphate pyrophosphatase